MGRRHAEVFLDVLRGEGFAEPNPRPMFANPPGQLRLEPHAAGLRERGFKLDDREFKPHLTLGRVKPRGDRDARRALEAVPAGELARFTAREVVLMQSVLGPGGAKHTALRAFPLVG